MNKNKTLKYISYLSLIIISFLLILNLKNIFFKLDYIYLHVDERQLIDDIYNVFFLNDEFNRFIRIENNFFRNVLILISELIIGGNLDYGRLWNNIFVLICAPFFLFSNTAPIIVERIVVILLLYSSIYYFGKNFISKKIQNVFILFCFSIPGIFVVFDPPKPDVLILLTLFIGFRYLINDKNLRVGFMFLGISIGIKLTSLLPALILGVYLIYPLKKINTIKKILNSIMYTFVGILIAQPALLIPYPPIFKRIISQVKAAVLYDQKGLDSALLSSFSDWIGSIEYFYSINGYILVVFFALLIFELVNNFRNRINLEESYFLLTFCLLTLFHMLFISRVWIYYLLIPFLFLNCYFFLILPKDKSKLTKFIFSFYVIVSISGLMTNINSQFNYGFVENVSWTNNLNKSIEFIYYKYSEENTSYKYKLVYWDTDYYFPKKSLTYESDFRVLENWEKDTKLDPLNTNVDFIVTREQFDITNNYKVEKIGDLNIYYLSNR